MKCVYLRIGVKSTSLSLLLPPLGAPDLEYTCDLQNGKVKGGTETSGLVQNPPELMRCEVPVLKKTQKYIPDEGERPHFFI